METNQRKRGILLNGFPLSAFGNPSQLTAKFRRLTLSQLREVLQSVDEIISYIRHAATVELISRAVGRQLQPSNGVYNYVDGDIIIVAVLTTPSRGQEVTQLTEEDIAIYEVTVRFE